VFSNAKKIPQQYLTLHPVIELRRTHRRRPSFGEFFSSSSRWLVDQFARTNFSAQGAQQIKQYDPLSESNGGEDSNGGGEDFFSWLLPGSSSPQVLVFCYKSKKQLTLLDPPVLQEFGDGEDCRTPCGMLGQFALASEPSLMYRVEDDDGLESMVLPHLQSDCC